MGEFLDVAMPNRISTFGNNSSTFFSRPLRFFPNSLVEIDAQIISDPERTNHRFRLFNPGEKRLPSIVAPILII